MNKQLGYHWHPNFYLFHSGPLARCEVALRNGTPKGAKAVALGLLGFGFHIYKDGPYVISGIWTPLFCAGMTHIETTGDPA